MSKYDLIIVGQGLAGSVMAMELLERGFSVIVISRPELSACSNVAGGIWNPVVFKRLSKSWKVDELLPEMREFYSGNEKILNVKLITERNIIKLFSEQQEVDLWLKRANGDLSSYLDKKIYKDKPEGIKLSPFGYSKVLNAGNLDLPAYLSAVRRRLNGNGFLLGEDFDHKALQTGTEIKYKDIKAKAIIFAEGYLIKNNPLFSYVPMKPAKGEVLTIESDLVMDSKDVLTKNAFLMPLISSSYKTGATYNWEDLTDKISAEGLTEITHKLEKMISAGFKVIKQEAGVRPSVIDRRPVIGSHPAFKNAYLFNGLGTKGVMLAPYFAKRLADYIQSDKPLEAEVDLSRFNRFFVN